jgi:hypothetical protein
MDLLRHESLQQLLDHRRHRPHQPSRLRNRFQLPVNILGIAVLPNSHRTHHHYALRWINPVNHAVISELVLPVVRQRPAHRQTLRARLTLNLCGAGLEPALS